MARLGLLFTGILLRSTHIVDAESDFYSQAFLAPNQDSVKADKWTSLDSKNDALASQSSRDYESSLEKVDGLQAKFTELNQRLIAAADPSVGNDLDRLEEVTAVIINLQDYFEGKDAPAEIQRFLPTIQPILSKASKALLQIQGYLYVQQDVGPVKEKSREVKSGDRGENPPVRSLSEAVSNNRQYAGNGTAIRQTSRAEFELRARGHHGFLAEDKKINGLLHAPGGRGGNMDDSSYNFFSSDGFNGIDYLGQHSAFPGSFQSSSDHMFGGRKLNANGVCAMPNGRDLKIDRCERLVNCVDTFTLSGK